LEDLFGFGQPLFNFRPVSGFRDIRSLAVSLRTFRTRQVLTVLLQLPVDFLYP
jgi:hypothetical protein